MKILTGIKFLLGKPNCLKWAIWNSDEGIRSISMLDVGYREMPFFMLYLGMFFENKFRIKSKTKGFFHCQIEFSVNDHEFYFDTDDWGGGRILPADENTNIESICNIFRNDKRFLFTGEDFENEVRARIEKDLQ